jgi:hypothetical protein
MLKIVPLVSHTNISIDDVSLQVTPVIRCVSGYEYLGLYCVCVFFKKNNYIPYGKWNLTKSQAMWGDTSTSFN